jgi:hypothetical protein
VTCCTTFFFEVWLAVLVFLDLFVVVELDVVLDAVFMFVVFVDVFVFLAVLLTGFTHVVLVTVFSALTGIVNRNTNKTNSNIAVIFFRILIASRSYRTCKI